MLLGMKLLASPATFMIYLLYMMDGDKLTLVLYFITIVNTVELGKSHVWEGACSISSSVNVFMNTLST